jgi:hypothetical protein
VTVELRADETIALEGLCPSEDAEALLQLLTASPTALVDWRGCESAHTAVIQVLLAAKPRLQGPPMGAFLNEWVAPLLALNSPATIATVFERIPAKPRQRKSRSDS